MSVLAFLLRGFIWDIPSLIFAYVLFGGLNKVDFGFTGLQPFFKRLVRCYGVLKA